jgi:tetratricopeptide (TPR) repeat protein
VVDDELLQELLSKGTGLYGSGDYRGAIEAWREALAVDPSSQRAREGIQMATLLLADFDPAATNAVMGLPAAPPPRTSSPIVPPAKAPRTSPPANDQAARDPKAITARLDAGIRRVRELLKEGQYSEAIEGARGLVPIDPDSEEVQRLVEEAEQAFESAPFIDEHLTLSRELLAQDRRAEAETECRKVFALDPANPDAHALIATIRAGGGPAAGPTSAPDAPAHPAAAAPPEGDLGGRTMRIDRTQLQALHRAAGVAPEGGAPPVTPPVPDTSSEETFDPEPAAGTVSAVAPESAAEPLEIDDTLPPSGDGALEIDLEDPGLDLGAVEEAAFADHPAIEEEAATSDASGTLPELEIDALPDDLLEPESAAPALEAVEEPEIVEATTVVPPSVRLVTRTDEPNESVEQLLKRAEGVDLPALDPAAAEPDLDAIEHTPVFTKEAPPAAPPETAAQPASKPAGGTSGGWEQELETLNRKTGEHEIVGRAAARAPATPAPVEDDLDLSSLLGDEIGPLQGVADEHEAPADNPSIPLSPQAEAAGAQAAAGSGTSEPDPAVPAESFRASSRPARPSTSVASERGGAVLPSARGGRSLSTWFALAGVIVLAAAAAVWWFFFQPRVAMGHSLPAAAAGAPPSGSSGTESRAGAGPIPTPIGSTSRQTTQETVAPPGPAPANPPPASSARPAGAQAAPATAPVPGPGSSPASAPSAGQAPAAEAKAKPRTPEEARQEAVQQKAKGKAALAAGQWVQARDAFAAVMALDPVDFESKQLLDQVQVKVDEEKKVYGGYDEARRLFDDRDYQGALWKLYRLPQDGRLGNLDIPVRNSWFNWAVVALKGGDATDARQKLQEVLSVDPDDAEAAKMMGLVTTYASRPKDRAFYSFVDTLRFRAFDKK